MKNISTSKNLFSAILIAMMLFVSSKTSAQITENFDMITTLTGSGWFMQNNSVPVGSTGWFQGNPAAFVSFNGATDSYIGANFNNTTGANTISNWLVTPNMTLKNGDVITFYTRTTIDNMWADNLQVRMSTNGTSTNVGVGSAAVGDFTTLLLEINPTLALSTYPMAWTQYTIVISGLSAPTAGRLAFRYYVTDGGPSGSNSDYIGIDNFVYTPYVCPTLTVTPGTLPNATAGVAYTQSLGQTGALGTPTYTVTAGTLPPGVVLSSAGVFSGSPSATGTYNFTVTVSDASGCSGSLALSIIVDCPTNGATLSSFPTLCNNDAPILLSQGSPSGGIYSGTGVSAGMFDPASGTQNITYTLVDVYSCTQIANSTITVNTAPTVTLTPFTDVCSNDGSITLNGGTPGGGTYIGTGVTAGSFDPTVGTQTISYTFTDVNGCTNIAAQTITVNTAPVVTFAPLANVCEDATAFALTGGLPAGGTYSGTGVTAGMFDPTTQGTFTITYSVTDLNNCTDNTTQDITVDNCLGLTEENNSDFICYPNPSNGLITIQFSQTGTSDAGVRILNAEGKVIRVDLIQGANGVYTKNFDLSEIEKGIYFIEVTTSNGVISRRIVLQ